MAELPDSLVLDLADPLTGDAEDLAHLLQGVGATVVHAEAHPQHVRFPLGEGTQNLFQGFGKQCVGGGIGRAGGPLVLYEGADGGILFVTYGGIQTQGIGSGAVGLNDFFHRQTQLRGDLLHGGFPAQLLNQLPVAAGGLVDDLYHMHRHPDGPGLVRNGPGNGLPDPPGGICRELVSLCPVKLINRADQSRVALLDQIQNVQAPAGVFFGDGDNQTQVGLRQLVLGLLVAFGYPLCQFHFLFRRQELHLTDLLQIHPHRVVQAVFRGQIHRVNEFFLFDAPQIQAVIQPIPQAIAQYIQRVIDLQLRGDDLDVHGVEPVIDLLNLLRGELHLFQNGTQLRIPDHALFFALCNQGLHSGLQILHILCRLLGSTHSQIPLYLCLCYDFKIFLP